MSLNPDIQKKAQTELDRVIGPDRLPSHDDRPELPYIDAIVKEALRWQNVLPLGLPHKTTEDMVYDGYFIPMGTIIIPDTRQVHAYSGLNISNRLCLLCV